MIFNSFICEATEWIKIVRQYVKTDEWLRIEMRVPLDSYSSR